MRFVLAVWTCAIASLAPASTALGAWDGTFTASTGSPIGVGSTPDAIAAGDFDQDGDLDLAVANRDSADLTVLAGDGTGSFNPVAAVPLANNGRPTAIVTANFNGDGDPDLAIAEPGANVVAIFTGKSGATFDPTTVPVVQAPSRLAVADFNRDTTQDLAVLTGQNGRVTILKGAGNSTFTAATPTTSAGDSPSALASADFNDDGAPDLAVTSLLLSTVTELLGDGAGAMARQTTQPSTDTGPLGIVAGDFNADRDPDLATANSGADDVSIFTGQLGPGFTAGTLTGVGDGPSALATGDFNADGDPDLAVTNQAPGTAAGSVSVLLGGAGAAFAAASASPFPVGAEPLALAVADLNGDGIQDVATADGGGDSVTVLLGNAATSPPPADTTPPETTIDKGPTGKTSKHKAKIAYSANESATFECALRGKGVDKDLGQFSDCGAAKVKYKHLGSGKKKFQVRAVDQSGNVDKTPAKLKWKVLG